MAMPPFERTVLSKEVFQNLRDLIVNKKLKPGDKLPNEIELARMMGVSRSTVREAIKTLASSNIVEVVRGKGTFVCQQPGIVKDPLGVDFMNDKNIVFSLFEARILMEPGVAYLAAERVNKTDLKKIKECINRAKLNEAFGSHIEEDLEFHQAIAKATRNPIIHRIIPIINQSIIQGSYQTINIPDSVYQAIDAHLSIYNAIKSGDPVRAREEMQRHLEQAVSYIRAACLGNDKK